MRITKRQLRRIIKEERRRLLEQGWGSDDDHFNAAAAGIVRAEQAPAKLAAILKRDANRGTITVEQGSKPDELYIMTGAAEGITVKVLRSGR
jgi:hypothetical protein